MLFVTCIAITSPIALVGRRAAPDANDIAAARNAYVQITSDADADRDEWVNLDSAQLSSIGALASQAFAPTRFRSVAEDHRIILHASRPLRFNRWLNLTLTLEAPHRSGHPVAKIRIGHVRLSPLSSRLAIDAALWAMRLGDPEIPQLDELVQRVSIENGAVRVLANVRGLNWITRQMAHISGPIIAREQPLRAYCDLADLQERKPTTDFAEQVRRVFSLNNEGESRSAANAAAFVALGMLIVDARVGQLVGLSVGDVTACRASPLSVTIYGRQDWPRHWALSAALAVTVGRQPSEAAGDWKELLDSVGERSKSAADPSGFSMTDLAANRAGFQIAQAAVVPDRAAAMADKLARSRAEQLLPAELTEPEERLSNEQFVTRYGGVADPRFRARVQRIDAVIGRSGGH